MARRFPTDAARLSPGPAGAGVNEVHARMARLAAALRAPARTAPVTAVRRWTIASIVGLTVLINAIAIAVPMVVLAVFDYVVRDGAHLTLASLCATGGLAIVYELMLRRERAALAADVGVRTVAMLASNHFAALLQRDVREVGAAPVSAQVARFRALRSVRRFLTGPVVGALLDAPFALVMAGVLFAWFGPVGFAPLAGGAALAAAALLLRPFARRTAQQGERTRAALRVALAEAAAKRETLDEIGMTAPWAQRIEALAVESASRRGREAMAEAAIDTVAHAVTALVILAALWLGAARVMDGATTVGAVIAATLLAWRTMAPLEAIFRAGAETRSAMTALRAAGRAEARPFERNGHLPAPALTGRIAARGLVVRAHSGEGVALRGVSFDVAAGEIVAVCGPAGSGKSTLLGALMGLTPLEAGVVSLDGHDLRGLDPAGVRTQTAYAPQRTTLFHGTVAQNIRLMAPAADGAVMTRALARAGVTLPHPQLPEGLDTRLMSGGGGQIDESLRVKIMLAGLYAKDARIYLLDDPGAFLDRDGDGAFLRALDALRGRATVLLVTNRPSHMRACDRIIRLEHGMVVTDGRVEQVLGAG